MSAQEAYGDASERRWRHRAGPGRDPAGIRPKRAGQYLVFTPLDQPDRLLIFETGEDKRVTSFRAGHAQVVRLIEGCLGASLPTGPSLVHPRPGAPAPCTAKRA